MEALENIEPPGPYAGLIVYPTEQELKTKADMHIAEYVPQRVKITLEMVSVSH
jgi:hypothetical protein